jgi:hypothetical protein
MVVFLIKFKEKDKNKPNLIDKKHKKTFQRKVLIIFEKT